MERQSIRLIAADLDGTLLNGQKQVSERNLQAIRRAADQGILFVPSTGRIFQALPDQIRTLPFLRYCITVNGGGVYDRESGQMIFQAEIPEQEAQEIFSYIRRYDTMYDCYQNGQGYISEFYYNRIDAYCMPEFRALVRATRRPVPSLEEFLQGRGPIQKLQMFFRDLKKRETALRELPERFPNTSVTSSVPNNIEVNIAEANKGNALRVLCEHLHIDLAEAAAFGDGTNDMTMIRMAGVGVAMGNAVPQLKEQADYVTLSNDEDGVAVFLEQFVL